MSNQNLKLNRVDAPRHITTAYGVPVTGTYHVLTEVVADMFGPHPTVVCYVIRKPDGKLARAYMGQEPDPDLPAPMKLHPAVVQYMVSQPVKPGW